MRNTSKTNKAWSYITLDQLFKCKSSKYFIHNCCGLVGVTVDMHCHSVFTTDRRQCRQVCRPSYGLPGRTSLTPRGHYFYQKFCLMLQFRGCFGPGGRQTFCFPTTGRNGADLNHPQAELSLHRCSAPPCSGVRGPSRSYPAPFLPKKGRQLPHIFPPRK